MWTIILSFFKKIGLVGILIFLLIVLIFVLGFLLKSQYKHKQTDNQVQKVIEYIDTGFAWRDKSKYWHRQVEEISLSKQASDILFSKYKDSIAKILKIKSKQINSLLSLNEELKGTFIVPIKHDTLIQQVNGKEESIFGDSFHYNDSTLLMNGFIAEKNVSVEYSVSINLQATSFWKKKWFLGKKKTRFDVTCNNPNINISKLQEIKIIKE